jgi:hypothetical protein
MGVTSFQALQAPMLIDSYSLERAVIASSIPGQMLQGLNKVGVHGLGVVADGLRKPAAVKHPRLDYGRPCQFFLRTHTRHVPLSRRSPARRPRKSCRETR